jgi:hypothetical protein
MGMEKKELHSSRVMIESSGGGCARVLHSAAEKTPLSEPYSPFLLPVPFKQLLLSKHRCTRKTTIQSFIPQWVDEHIDKNHPQYYQFQSDVSILQRSFKHSTTPEPGVQDSNHLRAS